MSRFDWLFSLQARLILASAAVVTLAIFVTGGVFVYRDWQEQRTVNLQRIAAATQAFSISSPVLTTMNVGDLTATDGAEIINSRPGSGAGGSLLAGGDVVVEGTTLKSFDASSYRILVVSPDGEVVSDPTGSLSGVRLEVPSPMKTDVKRGYVAWPGDAANVTGGLTFIAPADVPVKEENGFKAVAVINSTSLTADWLATAPDLALSGLVGLPVAILAGVLATRRITHPLRRLTHAVEGMSRGDFDQRVELRGRDEVATLASSFTVMAGRVKERDTQLRNLIANVSHDLRTPLTSIQGYAEALADGVAEPKDVDRVAGIIRDEARHASSLLANLLGLSEIESGEVIVRSEPFDLSAMVQRCVRRLEPRANERGIVIVLRWPESLEAVGDEEKTERAFANLIENAVKFATANIEVSAGLEEGNVVARVANDGPPIEAETADRIFDRFYRAPGPSAGTGLGLAIARELVELQGGHLGLQSAAAPVEFRLVLPAKGASGRAWLSSMPESKS